MRVEPDGDQPLYSDSKLPLTRALIPKTGAPVSPTVTLSSNWSIEFVVADWSRNVSVVVELLAVKATAREV